MKSEQEGQALKSEEVYIDANLFIYAAIDVTAIGDKARKVIEEIENEVYTAYTASLTFDEVLWGILKSRDKETAYKAAESFLSISNLKIIDVDRSLVQSFIKVYAKERLKPRDALHLAAMQLKNLKKILSEDADFDKVEGIQRIDFTK